jgi:hypothetical protein
LPIFTEKEQSDDRPLMRGEDLFAFYDRCPRRPFEVFRQLLNAWVAEMPDDAAAEVIARMRKGEDLGFATGLCEVILHRALSQLGFSLRVHPELAGTSNRLDFAICRDGRRMAYLEATTMNPPDAHKPRGRREGAIFETLNAATLPDDVRLIYEVLSYGKASPSLKKIKQCVELWARENAAFARKGQPVNKELEIGDWRFRLGLRAGFKPRPGGRRIAMYGTLNGRMVGAPPSNEGLGKALNEKATKYGDELDLPYVVAVFDRTDSLAYFTGEFPRCVAEVLFGTERTQAITSSGHVDIREARCGDGWFGHPAAPRRRNVSAVLVFPRAEPWHLAEPCGQPLLVKNPRATRPLPPDILPTNEFVIDEREARVVNGRSMSSILGLPDPWPPPE